MASKFLSKNGEIYRILLENEDTFWLISFDNPMERPFCVTASELSSFQRVPAPQDFLPEEQNLSSAAQQRLALIQPLLDVDAITDRQLRLSIAKDIAKQQNTTPPPGFAIILQILGNRAGGVLKKSGEYRQ